LPFAKQIIIAGTGTGTRPPWSLRWCY